MTTTETKKRTRINLAIESGPHALLKVTAAGLGLNLDDAYTEAARLFNAHHVKRGANGGATVPLSQALTDEAFRNAEIARLSNVAKEKQAEIIGGRSKRSQS